MFYRTPEELEDIVKVCVENNIEVTGSLFRKKVKDIKDTLDVCRRHNVEVMSSMFRKSPEEVEKIISLCEEKQVEMTGTIFMNSVDELKQSIDYVDEKYGKRYLKSLIVVHSREYLSKVLPYLERLEVLPYVLNTGSILNLKQEEIEERRLVLEECGMPMIKNNKFNSVFGLSDKAYHEKYKDEIAKVKTSIATKDSKALE